MKKQTIEKMKTEALVNKLSALDEKYYNAVTNHSCHNLGHGYGMRAYTRIKHMSFKVTDNLRDTAEMIAQELKSRNEKVPYTSYLKISI